MEGFRQNQFSPDRITGKQKIRSMKTNFFKVRLTGKMRIMAGIILLAALIISAIAYFHHAPEQAKVKGTFSYSSYTPAAGSPGTVIDVFGETYPNSGRYRVLVHFDDDPDPNGGLLRFIDVSPFINERVKQSNYPNIVEPFV
jgi:hypothetical protein